MGDRKFCEYEISPYDYETLAASADTGEGSDNSAQSDDVSEESSSENGEVERATQNREPDQMFSLLFPYFVIVLHILS